MREFICGIGLGIGIGAIAISLMRKSIAEDTRIIVSGALALASVALMWVSSFFE